ncbi:unnamed protein product [Durusdinium trenchii]|uniref:SAP domain-containing protein n=1 Tax=Durusdinium trenchii TaxID=1381693 RepID=A0ABP0MW42_9DINO
MEPVKQPAISDLYGLTTLHMMMLLMTLSRKDLCEKCELFGISKMGNVPELRDRLFLHFLQNATEENLLGLPAYQAEADALPHESDGAAGIEDSGKDAHVPLSETKEDAAVPEAPEKALSGKPETPRGSGFPISPETDMLFDTLHAGVVIQTVEIRNDLKQRASDFGLAKSGNTDALKTRIIDHWLSYIMCTESQLIKYIKDQTADAPADPSPAVPNGGNPVRKDTDAAPGKSAPETAHEGSGGGNNASSSTPSNSLLLFGRRSFAMTNAEVQDQTSFFADIGEGPAVQDGDTTTCKDIIEEAKDGLIPLAACVKMSQGFQEVLDEQVAVLLAGPMKLPKKANMTRQFVSRLVMGPASMHSLDLINDELDGTGLQVWGLVVQEESLVDLEAFKKRLNLSADCYDGIMKREAPLDLSAGSQWLTSGFLNFGSAEEALRDAKENSEKGEQARARIDQQVIAHCTSIAELKALAECWETLTSKMLTTAHFMSQEPMTVFEAGGFSANGQPVDQIHHLLRARLELTDADDVQCHADLRKRPRAFDCNFLQANTGIQGYSDLPIGANGQPERPKAFNQDTLLERTLLAWQSMPRKAFIAAWTMTGYFSKEHFPEGLGLSQEDATATLDATGMLRAIGIRDDNPCMAKDANRWYWSLRMPNGSIAALPTLIANAVEVEVCKHRRERKVLFFKQPHAWQDKLKATNAKIMTIVYNLRQGRLATAQFLKRCTSQVSGKLEFLSKGNGHEMLRIHFQLREVGGDPTGPGAYYLPSKNFEQREICCVSTNAERNGFDILREAYAGRVSAHISVCPISFFFR